MLITFIENSPLKIVYNIGYWFHFYIFVEINITDEIYSFEW